MTKVVIISYFICLSFCYNCILFWSFHFFHGMLNFISARRKWDHFKKLETYRISCMMPAKTTSNKPIKGIQGEYNVCNGSFNEVAGKHEKGEPGVVTLLVPLWGTSSPSTSADHYLHLLFEDDIRQHGLPSLCCPSPQLSSDLWRGRDSLPVQRKLTSMWSHPFRSSLWPCSISGIPSTPPHRSFSRPCWFDCFLTYKHVLLSPSPS